MLLDSQVSSDLELLRRHRWAVEMPAFDERYPSRTEIIAYKGNSRLEFIHPIMTGEVEFYEDGTKVGEGTISNRDMLHAIIKSSDERIHKDYTNPVAIKPGTERK